MLFVCRCCLSFLFSLFTARYCLNIISLHVQPSDEGLVSLSLYIKTEEDTIWENGGVAWIEREKEDFTYIIYILMSWDRKREMGRAKLPMKRIENYPKRQVSFSKRKKGLIKKAYELSVLADIDIALIIFSTSGRVTHFSGKNRFIHSPGSIQMGWRRRRFDLFSLPLICCISAIYRMEDVFTRLTHLTSHEIERYTWSK